jgi:putative (di)nucleoside polyphosphate hydrolase
MTRVYFRAGVGALVRDARGAILVLRRKDVKRWGWQLPQGGIDGDERPVETLWRELREETGLERRSVRLEREVPDWLAYELPRRYWNEKVGRGQVQRWFLCRLRGPRSLVKPDGVEFEEAAWITPAELVERAVPFRRAVYARLVEELGRPARKLRAPARRRRAR